MSSEACEDAIKLTEQTLEANEALQDDLNQYIADLESEQEKLDALIKNLSKVEASLPEEQTDYYDEVVVETAPYGENYESLRHTLTAKQLGSETSPFYQAVQQRQRYETLTTTRPFTREEQRILHVSVVIENKRLHALRARARGEDPFTSIQGLPDSFFDKLDPEISWSSVAQNMSSNPPRTADQCRIIRIRIPAHDVEENRDKLRIDWVEIARKLGTNRTALQCLKKFVFDPTSGHEGSTKARHRSATAAMPAKGKAIQSGERSAGQVWTKEEDKHLLEGVQRHGMVALHVNSSMSGTLGHIARTPNQCSFRYSKSLCPTIKKGRWSAEEDDALRRGVAAFGRTWIKVQEYVEGRTDAQCRERWSNMLDPSLKLGPWEPDEDRVLLDAVNRKLQWSAVSALLPGRTDSRCAKRYQILLKETESGQASTSTPTVKKLQKRSKKQLENAMQKGNEAEPQATADTGGPSAPSAGITPGSAPVIDEVPALQVAATRRAKPGRKPKVKERADGNALVGETDGAGIDVAPNAEQETGEGSLGGMRDAVEIASTGNSLGASVSNRTKRTKSNKETDEIQDDAAHTNTLRRSARVANKI
ncbi:Myb-like DNA-binding domain protein [Ceratobasidium sp. AG-Ba]|nr:Myb-like DNA-binding domain protein [Ceratobasidium sp. AG-Ba]QRW05402.1 Myb-like DNA-binding domain protein [Ceratobasidium sp. AG-Ba]